MRPRRCYRLRNSDQKNPLLEEVSHFMLIRLPHCLRLYFSVDEIQVVSPVHRVCHCPPTHCNVLPGMASWSIGSIFLSSSSHVTVAEGCPKISPDCQKTCADRKEIEVCSVYKMYEMGSSFIVLIVSRLRLNPLSYLLESQPSLWRSTRRSHQRTMWVRVNVPTKFLLHIFMHEFQRGHVIPV